MERKHNKQAKLHLKTGDNVKVISGDNKGKTGKLVKLITDKSTAIVEGLNIVTKHVKPTATNPNGGIKQIEAPIHISNLILIDPVKSVPTRTGRKKDANGKLKRYSKKTGEII